MKTERMSWVEAFRRALGMVFALSTFSILFGAMIVGGQLIASGAGYASAPFLIAGGFALAFLGYVGLILSYLAVWLKATTNAVSDHVERRLQRDSHA